MKYNVVLDFKEHFESENRLKNSLDYCFETCDMRIDVISVEHIKESNNYKYIAYIDVHNQCVITDLKKNEIEIIIKKLDLDKIKAKYNPKIVVNTGYYKLPDWCQGVIARYLPYICEV